MNLRSEQTLPRAASSGPSKTKLVVGAAGLLLFILGARRTFQAETAPEAEATSPVADAAHPTEAAA